MEWFRWFMWSGLPKGEGFEAWGRGEARNSEVMHCCANDTHVIRRNDV